MHYVSKNKSVISEKKVQFSEEVEVKTVEPAPEDVEIDEVHELKE